MPSEPNKLVRVIVPMVLALAGIGIAWAVMRSSAPKPASTAAQTTPAPTTQAPPAPVTTPATTASGTDQTAPPSTTAAAPTAPQPAPAPTPAATQPPLGKLKARLYPLTNYAPIGSTTPRDKGGQFEMEVQLSPFGAGIQKLALANHFTTIQKTESDVIQQHRPLPPGSSADSRLGLTAMAANNIEIDGQAVELALTPDPTTTFWREISPGAFEAEILGEDDQPIVRLTRTYQLKPGSYELLVDQKAQNVSGRPINIVWRQYGPTSLPLGTIRYGGDVRRVRFGYVLPAAKDPAQMPQASDGSASLIPYHTAMGNQLPTAFPGTFYPSWDKKTLWPNSDSTQAQLTLAWAGNTSRYFTVAVFPAGGAAPGGVPTGPRTFDLIQSVDRLAIPTGVPTNMGFMGWLLGQQALPVGELVLRLQSRSIAIAPGQSADLSMGMYAGPSSRTLMDAQAGSRWSVLRDSVIYTFGGPCGFCTFQTVAYGLRAFLGWLQSHVTFDWSLAIILLVVCVRTVLHPVTRWSQKSLYHFGRAMGKLAPKQKAIQDKYKDDPVKMREEFGRLMREEGVNYSGALGCLPAFLQMPIWLGLSAMIYFTFDLRHTHAFFGVFQEMTGHKWAFLGDLSEPDHLISFGRSFSVPLLSSFMGPIDGLNLLPLLMGLVFYIQQKYMTPPPSAPLTPEQEQQMKIMKVVTVVLFPVFMYNAPSGLALYFATNSTFAILESKWIRSIAEREEKDRETKEAADRAAGKLPKKNADSKKEGFFARLQRMAMEAEKLRDQQKKNRGKK
ncbi:MAG: membrane protein insertase YidC [Phycisphaerales bacterium]|nr:membrane protein insertase YidC [Phycisphaerales bacterium]